MSDAQSPPRAARRPARTPGPRFALPRSMATQLTLLLLAALLFSHTIITALMVDDRRLQAEDANRRMIVTRTISLLELIAATPDELHEDILNAASDVFVRFALDEVPTVVTPTTDRMSLGLSRIISRNLGGEYEVRLERSETPDNTWRARDRDWRRRAEERREERQARWRERHGDDRPPPWTRRPPPRGIGAPDPSGSYVSMSVGLDNGQWLNVTATFPPAHGWAWPAIAAIIVMAVLTVLIVAFSVRRIVKPLRALASAADKLGRGEQVEPLAEKGPSEVVSATRAFNAMEERLTRFIADRTKMLAAIGHDLRTPITSLRLRAEFIDDDENRERIVETLDEMAAMIEATLAFARDDAAKEAAETVNLADLLDGFAGDYADIGSDVAYEGPSNLEITCRATALKRALRNLVDNALRYGGGSARIRLAATPVGPAIEVSDDGPGIDPERLADVFEPFVRLETSRSQETGGVGLGLSIARSIARALGGDLVLENRRTADGGIAGLTARLTLPPNGHG